MKSNPKLKKLTHPPQGEPWVWITQALLESPAWRCMTWADRKVLDRLMLEHSYHAGCKNGELPCTYQDLARHGVRRRSILESLVRLSALGLIRRTHAGRRAHGTDRGESALYALTWFGTTTEHNNAVAASNDWKRYPTIEAAEKAIGIAMDGLQKERRKAARKAAKPIFPSGASATGSRGASATRDEARSRGDIAAKPISSRGASATTLNISLPSMDQDEPRARSDRDEAFVTPASSPNVKAGACASESRGKVTAVAVPEKNARILEPSKPGTSAWLNGSLDEKAATQRRQHEAALLADREAELRRGEQEALAAMAASIS